MVGLLRWLVFAASVWALAAPALAASPCPPTGPQREWSARCFTGSGAQRRVKQAYLRQLRLDRHGMATIMIGETFELVAVDRRGKVVVPGIWFAGDFDYPSGPKGISRFSVKEPGAHGEPAYRCGYFKAPRFRILVPARYEHCAPFHGTQTTACNECERYCMGDEDDCHDSVFIGGRADVIGVDGKVIKQVDLPTLDTVCKAPGRARVTGSGNFKGLSCADGQDGKPGQVFTLP